MAVLPGVTGISACIRVAGEVATEYQDPEQQSDSESGKPSSHCYIESRAGLEFGIETTVTRGYDLKHGHDHLIIWPTIDGQLRTGKTLDLKPVRMFTETAVLSTAYIASDTANMVNNANFVFIPITTSDDRENMYAHDPKTAKSLGTIMVEVGTARYTGRKVFKAPMVEKKKSITVHEKAMKGRELTHGSSLAPGSLIRVTHQSLHTDYTRIGTFHFYYRSHKGLQAQMIIPRSPSPTLPMGQDADLSHLSDAEIRRLARERLQIVKTMDENPASVKREPGSPPSSLRPLKLVKLDDGTEAIDLTEED
ncbi:hypothetical protein BKA56DRAFT_213412 [Ilyonectria sp. MPI-CAGE-AT-0026]|nr:hypothetical protein BKA56DRAFT_213412 [Ilyonectria sp. MPI-CAGE-AT-0026]